MLQRKPWLTGKRRYLPRKIVLASNSLPIDTLVDGSRDWLKDFNSSPVTGSW
jgi:hypothetical protein